jgi:crotonobetainyl-CoA:carnitine CoA-transferase CaiB-like acyl-CoA transferase
MGAEVHAQPAPKLGQDTEALLQELGYRPGEIEDLRAQGVI